MPDNKPQAGVFDDPALLDFGSKPQAGDMQSFDLKTGQGAQSYSRQQARGSLASKVKTTGEQSAEDISATAKEIYGPLYEPGETIQRNAEMYALPYQLAAFRGMPLKQAVKTAAGSLAGGMAGAYGGGEAGKYLGGIPGRIMNSQRLEKQGSGVGEGIGAFGGGMVGAIGGGTLAGRGGPLRLRVRGIPFEFGGEAPTPEVAKPSLFPGATGSRAPIGGTPAAGPAGTSPFSGSRVSVPGVTSPTVEETIGQSLDQLRTGPELQAPQRIPELTTGESAQSALERQSGTTARYMAQQAEKGGAKIPKARLAGKVSGRVGSAGDLASWQPEDLWSGYMKARQTGDTGLAEGFANEIKRRGLTGATTPSNVRPVPMASIEGEPPPSLKSKVTGGREDDMEMLRRGAGPANPAIKSVQRQAAKPQRSVPKYAKPGKLEGE